MNRKEFTQRQQKKKRQKMLLIILTGGVVASVFGSYLLVTNQPTKKTNQPQATATTKRTPTTKKITGKDNHGKWGYAVS